MGPKPKIAKIRIKTLKVMKAEKMSKEMIAADAMLIKPNEPEIQPVGQNEISDHESEGENLENLEIDEKEQEDQISDCESQKSEEMQDTYALNESKAMLRHVYGLMKNQLYYTTEKPWDKFVQDAGLSVGLLLKLTAKNYARINGNIEDCDAITMASSLDYNDEVVKSLLGPLTNSNDLRGKITNLEQRLELINTQGIENMTRVEDMSKFFSKNSKFASMQMVTGTLSKEMNEMQEFRSKGENEFLSISKKFDQINLTPKSDKVPTNYPFAWQPKLNQLCIKPGELDSTEIMGGIAGAITYGDPIVGLVIFETLGLKLDDSLAGKTISDFVKSIVAPLVIKNPELRIQQKLQFTRVYSSWDKILQNIINPGSLCATTVIEESRVCLVALADISADKLPVGVKMKSLGMNCMVRDQNQQRNTYILEKIMELKPASITKINFSYNPWPRNNEQWSPTMMNWSKGKLPKLKSASYTDIDLPSDLMSTVVSRKEFPYFASDNGNSVKGPKMKKLSKNQNVTGSSGHTVWDFINNEGNY
jgi:hypothetical protein